MDDEPTSFHVTDRRIREQAGESPLYCLAFSLARLREGSHFGLSRPLATMLQATCSVVVAAKRTPMQSQPRDSSPGESKARALSWRN